LGFAGALDVRRAFVFAGLRAAGAPAVAAPSSAAAAHVLIARASAALYPHTSVEQLLVTYTKIPLETIRAIVKPVFAEKAERSSIEPQLTSAVRFKVISRPVSYEEIMLA
jgi:hypothetical protein